MTNLKNRIWNDRDLNTEYVALVGVLITIISSVPLMISGLWQNGTGHDMFFHVMRIEGICSGIRAGQFPVRIQPEWYNGYGYACSVFYGDFFLWIPALLHLAGVSLQVAYKSFVLMANALTFVVSYVSFKGIFDNAYVASCGAVWYSLSLYRLINVYIRHAVGEYTAMIFFPLIAYALFCLLSEKPKLHRGMWTLILGVTGILQSHIISFELSICVMFVVCILYIERIIRIEIIISFIKAIGITVLINLWFIFPFVDYMQTGYFNANTISEYKKGIDIGEYGLFMKQLFGFFYGAGGTNLPISSGIEKEMPLGVGFCSLIIITLAIAQFILNILGKKDNKRLRMQAVSLAGIFVSLWMSSIYFPWGRFEAIHKAIQYSVISIQFPWRFLGIASMFISLLTCFVVEKKRLYISSIMIALAFVILIMTDAYMLHDETKVSQKVTIKDIGDLNTCEPSGEEYLPYGTDVRQLEKDDIRTTNVNIASWEKDLLNIKIECENQTDEQGFILLPLIYYKGYQAKLCDGGTCTNLDAAYGDNKRLLITVPSNFSGEIKVYWEKPAKWWISDIISLIAIGLLLGNCARNRLVKR